MRNDESECFVSEGHRVLVEELGNVTDAELGRACNVARVTPGRWRRGASPDAESRQALEDAFGVPLAAWDAQPVSKPFWFPPWRLLGEAPLPGVQIPSPGEVPGIVIAAVITRASGQRASALIQGIAEPTASEKRLLQAGLGIPFDSWERPPTAASEGPAGGVRPAWVRRVAAALALFSETSAVVSAYTTWTAHFEGGAQ